MDLSNQSKTKPNKTKQVVLILLIISVFAVIITIALMMILPNGLETQISNKDKIFVDDQENTMKSEQILLETEEGNKYLAIKELTALIGDNYFNGEYLKYTEDKTKCYIESIVQIEGEENNITNSVSNIVGLEANSDTIYKTNSESELDYEFIKINNKILQKNNNLYISIEDVGIVFGAYVNCSEENGLIIYTSKYLRDFYNKKVIEYGYSSIDTGGNNYKTIAYNLLIVNKNDRYGIIDLNFKEKVGTKYTTIQFNEYKNEFIVSSSNKNKYGIIDEQGNIKVNLIYDDISIINYSPLLYKVKIDNKYGIVNENGDLITDITYEAIGSETDLEIGLEQGIIIIPEISDEIKQSIVVKKDSKYGLIDIKTGEQIVECNLEKIYATQADGEVVYEAILSGQRIDLIQYVKAAHQIIVNM